MSLLFVQLSPKQSKMVTEFVFPQKSSLRDSSNLLTLIAIFNLLVWRGSGTLISLKFTSQPRAHRLHRIRTNTKYSVQIGSFFKRRPNIRLEDRDQLNWTVVRAL
jgi:hypothetical protein